MKNTTTKGPLIPTTLQLKIKSINSKFNLEDGDCAPLSTAMNRPKPSLPFPFPEPISVRAHVI